MPLIQHPEGARLAYRSAGTGPPELLFLHGWAGSAAYFEETIAALDLERVRATALDLNGHGESTAAEGEWSIDGIDNAVLEVADIVGAGRFVVVGFSMGGKFAQHVACRFPERVAGLVLVAGTPAAAVALPPELLEDWYARAGSASAMQDLVRGFLTGPVDAGAFERFGRDAALVGRSALEGTMRVTLEADFAAALRSLDTPTLAIGGQKDELFTPDVLRDGIVSQIPGARFALLDCGHEIPLERPRELAALIEAFLAGLHD